jgi:hypothetical protein
MWTFSLRGGWSGNPGPHETGHEILQYCEEQPWSRVIILWLIYERNDTCLWWTDLHNGETTVSWPWSPRKLIHTDGEGPASVWDWMYSPRWDFILSTYGLWHHVVCSFTGFLTTYQTTEDQFMICGIWFWNLMVGIRNDQPKPNRKKRRWMILSLLNDKFSIVYILSSI